MDNISSDFGELHCTDVNRLYQQLAVFWSLDDVKPIRTESLTEILIPSRNLDPEFSVAAF